MTDPTAALLRRARRLARAVKHTPDRLLHGRRRQRQLATLRGLEPQSVLFVCLGNICRSPYAAHVFQRMTGPSVRAVSAGFIGPGRPVPDAGQKAARSRGLDLSEHRSQFLTPELVLEADLVIVMDDSQRSGIGQRFGRREGVVVLGDLDPWPIDTRTVRDPYNQSDEVFEAVYSRIDRAVAALVDALALTPVP